MPDPLPARIPGAASESLLEPTSGPESEWGATTRGGYGEYVAFKRRLIGELRGRVLEIGAGSGANLAALGDGVRWIGLEPDPGRRRRLARTATASTAATASAAAVTATPGAVAAAAPSGARGPARAVVAGVAEALPLADGCVDAVLATVVLCSVRDQDAVLAEIRRVLRPGGTFVFVEHVAAPEGSWRSRVQRAWAPCSRRWDAGCDPHRATWRRIEAAGFAAVDLRWFEFGFRLDPHGPYVGGRAVR
ncbi:class I SAM-dependent methyltransferase [Streptacidiphilus sp. EB129]|uniref:class I SAM-dependent methyltransferase n=1 Tax=Streptacidiphilus sp. EB129 TaxID=3156262 RepID=UPI0035140350